MIKRFLDLKFIRNVRTLRSDLAIIFLLALLLIFLMDFWLINIPELFKGGYKIGQITYKLSFAYVSAFIFYFLVVHVKNLKDKENLYRYVAHKTKFVIGQAKALIIEISKVANVNISGNYPNTNELHNICLNINPNTNAPLLLGQLGNHANWLQYFDYFKRRTNDATSKILSKMQFLDSELVNKLANIEDCNHFNMLSNLIGVVTMPIANTNLIIFEPGLSNYFELIKDLENYYNKELIRYE